MRVYRASSLGYSLEALVAPHLGFEAVEPPAFLKAAFDEGHRIEPLAIQALKDRGWFIRNEQVEVTIPDILPGVSVVGHIDGCGGPTDALWGVVEVKMMADQSWKAFKKHGWDTPGLVQKYKWQQSAYCLATQMPHYMVAWNKDTEELAIEFVKEPFYTLEDIASKLEVAEGFIASGVVPDGCEDFPCPYYYLHPPKDEVEKAEDETLEELLQAWLEADKEEKAAKAGKDMFRGQILALTGDNLAAKVKGECGVTVETYWQNESEYTVKKKEGWVTRISGPRGKSASNER